MVKDVVDTVTGWQKQLNQVPQPPAADDRIRDLRQRSRAELGADIPEEYAELLRLADGFDWNGMVVYAAETTPLAGRAGKRPRFIQGFVEQNLRWREYAPAKDYLTFGDSGSSTYVYNVAAQEYQERDRQSDSLIGRHRTLAALLAEGLRHHKP